jgi:putative ABC transport system permease protein
MALFVGCIALGVAAVVIVEGLSNSVSQGIRAEGRRLMAGDVSVESRRELPEELDGLIGQFASSRGIATPIGRADLREFVSVVLAADTGGSTLAELKVVSGGYPFYSQLTLDPPGTLSSLLASDAVVVAPELLARLGLRTGDELTIGGAPFRIAGVVLEEPDKLNISFTLGPRVFLAPEGLARTALIGKGSRVEYRALLKLPDDAGANEAERLEAWLEAEMPEAGAYRVRTYTEAQPALRRSFDRMGRYLGLVGLLTLLVGGVGVAQVARAWLATRLDDIAVMRCLGARPREVVMLFLVQVLVLALLASAIGAAIGTGLHWLVPKFLTGMLPPELVRPWQPRAVAWGVLLGLGVAAVFTLPLLVGLRRVPPVRVLRRDAEPVRAGWLGQALAAALVLAGVTLAATWQSESIEHGSIFSGGLVGAVLLLASGAYVVSRIAALLPRDAGGVRLRHGLAHLARPGAATVGAIVALGLGVTFVFATWIVERRLTSQLQAELPTDAPSTFFLDVQPDQWPQLEALLKREGATDINSSPIVTARVAAIDGVPVSQLGDRPRQVQHEARDRDRDGGRRERRPRRWALTREHRLTYGPQLPRGNRVIAGRFPAAPAVPNGLSIEEDFAEDLGVTVGSTITFDVQGVPVDLNVTSLRAIDWRTMGINFFLWTEPGPLNDAPQLRVATARLNSPDLPRIQSAVVGAFPNVTVIHIRDVMDKVLVVLERIALAVRALGAFTIAAGVVVLGGTITATQSRRAREVALLKTVGMTRRDVAAVFAIEYALTGLVAAVVGVVAGGLLAWGVIDQLMELEWAVPATEALVAIAATIALAVIAGLVASARALSARPVEVLRSE